MGWYSHLTPLWHVLLTSSLGFLQDHWLPDFPVCSCSILGYSLTCTHCFHVRLWTPATLHRETRCVKWKHGSNWVLSQICSNVTRYCGHAQHSHKSQLLCSMWIQPHVVSQGSVYVAFSNDTFLHSHPQLYHFESLWPADVFIVLFYWISSVGVIAGAC